MRNPELRDAVASFGEKLQGTDEAAALERITRGIQFLEETLGEKPWLPKLIHRLDRLEKGEKGILPLLEEPVPNYEKQFPCWDLGTSFTVEDAYQHGFLVGNESRSLIGGHLPPIYFLRVWVFLLKEVKSQWVHRMAHVGATAS